MTIEELRKSGWIAYEYIRGSYAYGLNTPTSDEDHGGVFICPQDNLYGLRSKYPEQIQDKKGDVVFYEFGRWIELLLKSNPTALESLFIPERCIIGKVHPAVQKIIDNRDMFLSKECFKTLHGYAVSQISKARGLNKKCVNPVTERKTVLDFCSVPYKQGSKKVADWLRDNGLKQKYCGLVALPNMHDTYGLYYDWGTHLICEYKIDLKTKPRNSMAYVFDDLLREQNDFYDDPKYVEGTRCFMDTLEEEYIYPRNRMYGDETEFDAFVSINPYGFTGIVSETGESNDVRVCEVPKNLKPLTVMTYNKSGYESHCRDYKEYKEWEQNRNPVRYESNLNKTYDGKNLSHTMRLMRMGRELAETGTLNIDRTAIDRDFLLAVKNHEFEYDDIMKMVEEEKVKMNEAEKLSGLPDQIDVEKINDLLIKTRKLIYNNYMIIDNPLIGHINSAAWMRD